jgi:hypothetical protein
MIVNIIRSLVIVIALNLMPTAGIASTTIDNPQVIYIFNVSTPVSNCAERDPQLWAAWIKDQNTTKEMPVFFLKA